MTDKEYHIFDVQLRTMASLANRLRKELLATNTSIHYVDALQAIENLTMLVYQGLYVEQRLQEGACDENK